MAIPGLVPAGIKIGASLLGGLFGSSAAKRAARARMQAYNSAIDTTGRAFDQAQEFLDPRLEQEGMAMDRVNALMGLTDESFDFEGFRETPGYQFQQDEARRQIERSAAARGGLASGNTLAALLDRSQGIADSTFQNYLRQVMDLQNQGTDRLSAGMMVDRGNRIADLELGRGGVRASGIEDSANQHLNMLGGITEGVGGLFGGRSGVGGVGGGVGTPPIVAPPVTEPFRWDWTSANNWGR